MRKSGNQIRVTAQLIDVATDAHLWSKTYDGKLENIFAVQDTISRAVAEALNLTLLSGATLALPAKTNPKAYNAYLQGEHFYKLRGPENREKALGYYEQALAIDSSYAPAWVGLSNVYRRLATGALLPFEEGYRKARQAAEKALALDPNLATAYVAIGRIKIVHDWDWAGADAAFKRALDLEPGNRRVIGATAGLAFTLGRFEEALALNRRAIELDPVSVVARDALGLHAYYAGRLEEAEAAFRKVLELSPRAPESHTHLMLGLVYLEKGEPDSALAEMLKVTSLAWRTFGLALAYHAVGKKKEADAVLADFIKVYAQGWAYQIVHIYAFRGEADEAFAWLERAYQQRDPGLASIGASPLVRNIKKDPRFAAFMKKMKLPFEGAK